MQTKLRLATLGEVGLAVYFLEQRGLLLPSTARIAASLAIEHEGQYAGLVQLYEGHAPPGVVGISIFVLDAFRGKGLGAFALEELFKPKEEQEIKIEADSIHRWEACGELTNKAAIKLFEKFGFEREGVLKKWYPRAGEHVDAVLYAKVK